ncbi:MAG TPA: energy transducer TonB [Opitutaceae bacterium]|nr:energy transducer TonB [Opitutaceae bacterium]
MTTDAPFEPAITEAADVRAPRPMVQAPAGGSCRYPGLPRSRKFVSVGVGISAALHIAIFFGIRPEPKKAAALRNEHVIELSLTMPDLKELEEPDPEPSEAADTTDLRVWVPMQMDLPQLPQLHDFVQQLDFSSFVDRTDLNKDKMWSIPENMRGGKLGGNVGNIFNLRDVERAPSPIFQPPPDYPSAMRREAIDAQVVVEFIVSSRGEVVNAFVISSTHHAFEDAALAGVGKWKFRPGLRGGRKVNTRLRVPILFRIVEG